MKEELRVKDAQLSSINQLYFDSSNKLIEHLTGLSKTPRSNETVSVPITHTSHAIREKIREAEQKDKEQHRLNADKKQRDEYNARIQKELNNVQGSNGQSIEELKTEAS